MRKSTYLVMFLLLVSFSHADLYNTTLLDDADNLLQTTQALNTIVKDFIGLGFLLAVFLITTIIVSQRNLDMIAGLGAGSFITAISAIILLPLGLIGFHIFRIVLLGTGAIVAVTFIIRR